MNGNNFGAGVPAELGKGIPVMYPGDGFEDTDKDGNKYFHYHPAI